MRRTNFSPIGKLFFLSSYRNLLSKSSKKGFVTETSSTIIKVVPLIETASVELKRIWEENSLNVGMGIPNLL